MINVIKDLYRDDNWYDKVGKYNQYISGNSDENKFFYYLENFSKN